MPPLTRMMKSQTKNIRVSPRTCCRTLDTVLEGIPLKASTPLGVTPFAAVHRMYLVVCLLTRTLLRSVGLAGGVANSSCRNGGRGRSPRMFAISGARLCGLDFRFRRGDLGRPRAADGVIREPPLVKCQTQPKYIDHTTRVALRARVRV